MATWRRRAIELFPELRRDLNRRASTPYRLFPDLIATAYRAHQENDHDTLTRIYGFAAECLSSPSHYLSEAAAVSFYEFAFSRFENWDEWHIPLAYIKPEVIRKVWGLWEAWMDKWAVESIRLGLKRLGRSTDAPPEANTALAQHCA